MRVSTVALCTLTALAAQEFQQQAHANPAPNPDDKRVAHSKRLESNSIKAWAPVEAIAHPERLAVEHSRQRPIVYSRTQREQAAAQLANRSITSHTIDIEDESGLPEFSSEYHAQAFSTEPSRENESDTLDFDVTQIELLSPEHNGQSFSQAPSTTPDNSQPEHLSNQPSPIPNPQVPPLTDAALRHPDNLSQSSPSPSDQTTQPTQGTILAQANTLPTLQVEPPPPQQDIDALDADLQNLEDSLDFSNIRRSSPALTIAVPSGFGVDNNTVFFTSTFQEDTRYSEEADGAIGFGIGLGDARRAIGAEISYTVASFGGSRNFGTGGFNVRLHRRLTDNLSASVGWRGILTTGNVDFRDSIYGAVTQIFHTREELSRPFSRIAVTAGVGSGQFRTEEDVLDGNGGVGAFGSIAVRVVQPVSFITEWTGQDLALGLSIAPFKNRNIVITPAVRDIAGGGDEARFVLGAGVTF